MHISQSNSRDISRSDEVIEPGHWAAIGLVILASIVAAVISVAVRAGVYLFYQSFSWTDEPTILCVVLFFLTGSILAVKWIVNPRGNNPANY